MDRAEVDGLVDEVWGVDAACRDRAELASAVAALRRLRAWIDSREVVVARQLAEVTAWPEGALASASRSSLRDAARVMTRGHTLDALPEVDEAMTAGALSAAHVDVIGRALRRLEPDQRPHLVERDRWLAELATRTTPDELEQAVAAEVRHLSRSNGLQRLERQRRAIRLRSWIDDDGMWCLSGRFDPETGIHLHQRLATTVARLFAEALPEGAPDDPMERQAFLRGHALVGLIAGDRRTRPEPGEIVVVIDTRTVDHDGAPTIDWGLPVELPDDVLVRSFETADVRPVVVHGGVVVHAPGQLDLGRTTRLANRAQRRALRALYPTCAIPGCSTRFDLCKLHHVIWWEHGGSTDLANLLPICVPHHHAVHDGGWQLWLGADRQLSIRWPDGTQQTTGPPRRGTPDKARRTAPPLTPPADDTLLPGVEQLEPLLL